MAEENEELKVPTHLGFIMDGNRRWAKEKGLPTLEGHRQGFDAVTQLIENCLKKGVKHVTIFAFSTENWDRSKEEIDYLMDLFRKMLDKIQKKFRDMGVKVNIAGRITDFPEDVQKSAIKATFDTKDNDKMYFNVAFSYGGRAEIVDATKQILKEGLKPDEITEDKFSQYIYESGQPDPDMIVRTSGEYRLSGFMLWQSAYAELYFTEVYWPDFNEAELDKVIDEYNRRERRFGK